VIVAALALALATPQKSVTLSDIRMHLFYETTGRLSPDLTQQRDFAGWNVIIGAGSAEEPADDLLVVAELRSTGEQFVQTPLKIVATAHGKVLASRVYRTFLMQNGQVALPVWVKNAGCAGTISVTVTFGAQRRSEKLTLQCGE